MKVLVVSGHNDLKNSLANATILNEIEKQLPQAEVRKLDVLYPDGKFDVSAEQKALLDADLIVLQFPMFWFSLPALLKKWLDDVFLYGFAYGSSAQLKGKKLLVSVTTGAPAAAYTGQEGSVATFDHLVEQCRATAIFCNMEYQGALSLSGISFAARNSEEAVEQQRQESLAFANKLIARIKEIEGA